MGLLTMFRAHLENYHFLALVYQKIHNAAGTFGKQGCFSNI